MLLKPILELGYLAWIRQNRYKGIDHLMVHTITGPILYLHYQIFKVLTLELLNSLDVGLDDDLAIVN